MLRKNVAGQFVHIQGVDATTGGIKSGVTWTMRRCLDGTFAAGGATITEDSTNGWYKVALTQADTNGNDIGYNFTGTGAVPQTINVIATACDPTAVTNFGITGIPAVASGSAGALLVDGTGTAAISNSSGKVLLQATQSGVTIPTVTNLTNAPTAGDLTATMKTSVQTAADAAITANTKVSNINTATNTGVAPGDNGGLFISGANTGPVSITGSLSVSNGVTFTSANGPGLTVSSTVVSFAHPAFLISASNGAAIQANAGDGYAAMLLTGGASSGPALQLVTNGDDAFVLQPTGGYAINAAGQGTGKHAINLVGGANADGFHSVGTGTGNGGTFNSGGGSTGRGVSISSLSGNDAGLFILSLNGNDVYLGGDGEITNGVTGGAIGKVDLQTIKTQTVNASGAVTIPAATLASTTNITAGTITTVTNLTNAPTAGDFTATMKTSLNAATPVATLSTTERAKLTGFTTVVHVANTGNSTTDGATLKAAILAATAGTLIVVDAGHFIVDNSTGLVIPDGVTIRGAGRRATVIDYGSGNLLGITPGSYSTIENLKLYVSFDDYALFIAGSTQVINATVRDVEIVSDNLECVVIDTTAACTLTFEDVYIQSQTEWAMTLQGAAHQMIWDRVTTYTVSNPNITDIKSFLLNNGATIIATDCDLLASETSSTGDVFRVTGSSVAILSNCQCFDGQINIVASGGYVLATDCQFDRSKVIGFPARLVDVSSVSAVNSGGITAASLASGAITAAKFASGAIDSTALNATAAAKIADTTLRRTMAHVEASSDGDALSVHSVYGSIQQGQKSSVNNVTWTVYQTDGTTSLGTFTLTDGAGADPIIGVT